MSNDTSCITELLVVNCTGRPRERGEQHGEALREQISVGLRRWADSIASTHNINPNTYFADLVQETNFLPAIRTWAPDLLEEMDGIAHASNQPWARIYACNLMDEGWTWARARSLGESPGCTAAGLAPEGVAPLLAQTMDIPSIHDEDQAVLRIEPHDGPTSLVFTRAGMIGLTGCNADGLALVVNALPTLPASTVGLPVAFVVRGILGRRSLTDAVKFARDVPHATGQHYGIASPSGLVSIEGWYAGVAIDEEPGAKLLHTNHPLLSADNARDVDTYRRLRTRERLDFIEHEATVERTAAGLQTLLSDRSVPISLAADQPSMTFGAVVYECDVPPRMWVAPGPPHVTAFQQVSW